MIWKASNWLVLLALSVLLACSNEQGTDSNQKLPKDFIEFYDAFHSDANYQLAHIAFPLPMTSRSPSSAAYSDSSDYWTPENWILHRKFMNDGTFVLKYDILTPEMIVETITQNNSPLGMQRRFAKMSDGWNLIYYQEMKPIGMDQ